MPVCPSSSLALRPAISQMTLGGEVPALTPSLQAEVLNAVPPLGTEPLQHSPSTNTSTHHSGSLSTHNGTIKILAEFILSGATCLFQQTKGNCCSERLGAELAAPIRNSQWHTEHCQSTGKHQMSSSMQHRAPEASVCHPSSLPLCWHCAARAQRAGSALCLTYSRPAGFMGSSSHLLQVRQPLPFPCALSGTKSVMMPQLCLVSR